MILARVHQGVRSCPTRGPTISLFRLAISTIIALVPVAIFLKIRGRLHHGGGSRLGTVVAGCAGVWMFVVGGKISLGILLTSPTPWERERIFDQVFRTPPEEFSRAFFSTGTQPGHVESRTRRACRLGSHRRRPQVLLQCRRGLAILGVPPRLRVRRLPNHLEKTKTMISPTLETKSQSFRSDNACQIP